MLINVKMPTSFWHFYIYEQDKFHARLSWAWKKFYKLRAWFSHDEVNTYIQLQQQANDFHLL